MEEIHLVTVTNNDFAPHLAVMLYSLLENKISPNPIKIYTIDSNISEENKWKLNRAIEKFNVKIDFLSIDKSIYRNFMTQGHLTKETYYRISIPHLLDKQIQKVIYLDCDLIIKGDITRLWNKDLTHYFMAAVKDPCIQRTRNRVLSMPDKSPYFNAGVLLINLKKWRNHRISEKVIQYIKNNRSKILWCSQDPLNAVLHDKWLVLDPKWNFQTYHLIIDPSSFQTINPFIIHFTGGGKPWNHYGHKLQQEYVQYSKDVLWDE